MAAQPISAIRVAPTASNMLPLPANQMELETASHDGADSGIGMKIDKSAAQIIIDRTNEGKKSPTKHRDVSTRGSWYTGIGERGVSSSFLRRYSHSGLQHRLLRLSTVSARNSLRQTKTFYQSVSEPISSPKGISWQEANDNRPPLQIDMSGPSPTTYSPCNKPLYETNAPAYTFGLKEREKTGSGQKAWSKTWFRSPSPYTHKTNYEIGWPSPFHYQQKSTLGPRQVNKPAFPSHSIGPHQQTPTTKRKPELTHEPLPTIYYPEIMTLSRIRKAPSHTMAPKLKPHSWTPRLDVPAPNMYNTLRSATQIKPTSPAFTICVMRRHKRHDLGPFIAL